MPADRPMQRAATWGIAILAAAAVGAGLALSGGPERGRKERRDDARLQDLGQLSQTINCLAGDSARLPAEIATTGGCPGPIRTVDPPAYPAPRSPGRRRGPRPGRGSQGREGSEACR